MSYYQRGRVIMFFDVKCGNCSTIFSISKEHYIARITNDPVFSSKITCPSCLAELPREMQEVLSRMLMLNGKLQNWEIGLRFHEDHK
ncbi:hypothetical protein D3C74_158400 [compost metagenome]